MLQVKIKFRLIFFNLQVFFFQPTCSLRKFNLANFLINAEQSVTVPAPYCMPEFYPYRATTNKSLVTNIMLDKPIKHLLLILQNLLLLKFVHPIE